MDWKAMALKNWPYKLAAVALALLLWFNVSANEERQEQPVRTELEFEVTDDEWIAVGVPDQVMTTFQGRRGDIFALPLRTPTIHKTIAEVGDTILRVDLSPADVEYDRQLDVRPVAVRPAQVELRFEQVTERRLPLTLDVEASPAEGFTLASSPVLQPESVTVRGARSEVEALSHLETERLTLADVDRPVTREVRVRVPSGLGTILVRPPQVLVTLRVDSLVERRFRVPVRVEGAPGTAEPDSVRVTLRGGRRALTGLDAGAVDAYVAAREAVSAGARLPVRVRLPEGVLATAVAEPASVTLRPPEEP